MPPDKDAAKRNESLDRRNWPPTVSPDKRRKAKALRTQKITRK